MSMPRAKIKWVWGSVERGGQTMWSRIGYAWEHPDVGLLAQIGAFPMSGRILIREGDDEAASQAALCEEAV